MRTLIPKNMTSPQDTVLNQICIAIRLWLNFFIPEFILFFRDEQLFKPVLFFLCCSTSLSAQKTDRDLLRAEKLYRIGQFDAAVNYYEKTLQREYDAGVCARLADCNRQRGEYLHAEHWYRQAVMADALEPEYFQQYAEVLRSNGKAEQALEWFERYDRYAGRKGNYAAGYALEAEERLLAPSFNVALLDINTSYSEIAPASFAGQLVFSSNRPGSGKSALSSKPGSDYYDIFVCFPEEEAISGSPSRIRGAINSPWNDVGFCVDPRSDQVWFTRTGSRGIMRIRDSRGIIHSALYTAVWKGQKLIGIERFPKVPRQVSAAHPCITPNGTRLYFATELAGGYGGMDIWYCNRNTQGNSNTWGDPVNAGSRINTPGDELFPFAASDSRLYFSSDGHPGLGGLDLFEIDLSGDNWQAITHLPAPLNSERDDFGLIVLNNQGFFASDRRGGRGSDDIYAFERISVRVEVNAISAETGQPLTGVQVELITDGQDNMISQTDARGAAAFFIPPGVTYYLTMQKSGFGDTVFTETKNLDRFTVALQPVYEQAPDPVEVDPLPLLKRYRIRLGIYRNPDMELLQSLENIGPLLSVNLDNRNKIFYLGPFNGGEQAAEALERLRERNFIDAFIEEWP